MEKKEQGRQLGRWHGKGEKNRNTAERMRNEWRMGRKRIKDRKRGRREKRRRDRKERKEERE